MAFSLGSRWVWPLGRLLALSVSVAALGVAISVVPAQAITPDSLAAYHQGVALERSGDLKGAETAFRNAMTADPDDALNYIKLASVLAQLGRQNEAISLYTRATQLNAQDPMLYFTLGGMYEQVDNAAKAEEAYRIGLRKNPDYAFGLLNLARTLARQEKYPDAITTYQAFLAQYPDHYEARRNLAHLLLATNHEPQAVPEFEALKNKFPSRFSDHLALARALNRANEPAQALEELKLAYAKDGDKAEIAAEMGEANLALGQTRFALLNYRKAADLAPANPAFSARLAELYASNNQPAQAIPYYERYLSLAPDDFRARQALADALVKTEQYPRAIALLRELIAAVTPDQADPAARYALSKQLAYALQMDGQLAAAIADYETLAQSEAGQRDPQLQKNLAIAYHRFGRLEDAIALYKRVYDADPQKNAALGDDIANALSHLGDRLYQTHDVKGARARYEEAARYAQPKNIAPTLGLATLSFMARQTQPGEADKAIALFERALAVDPDNEAAKIYLAQLNIERAEPQKAVALLEPLTSDPQNEAAGDPDLLATLANAYVAVKTPQKAVEAYEKAIARRPDDDRLLISLGNAWRTMGDSQKAIEATLKARALNPDNPMTAYNLGILYGETNRLAESEAAYREAIRLSPDFMDAYYGLGVALERESLYNEAIRAYETCANAPESHYRTQAQERIRTLTPLAARQKPLQRPVTKSPAQDAAMKDVSGALAREAVAQPAPEATSQATSQPTSSGRLQEPQLRALPVSPIAPYASAPYHQDVSAPHNAPVATD